MSSYVGGPFDGKTFTTPYDHRQVIILEHPDIIDGKLVRVRVRYELVSGMRVFLTDRDYLERYCKGRRRAPWKDYKGNTIYEGDRITHPVDPEWQTGIVEFDPKGQGHHGKWKVRYRNGDLLALCLQIGDKGQAVVSNGP